MYQPASKDQLFIYLFIYFLVKFLSFFFSQNMYKDFSNKGELEMDSLDISPVSYLI